MTAHDLQSYVMGRLINMGKWGSVVSRQWDFIIPRSHKT